MFLVFSLSVFLILDQDITSADEDPHELQCTNGRTSLMLRYTGFGRQLEVIHRTSYQFSTTLDAHIQITGNELAWYESYSHDWQNAQLTQSLMWAIKSLLSQFSADYCHAQTSHAIFNGLEA